MHCSGSNSKRVVRLPSDSAPQTLPAIRPLCSRRKHHRQNEQSARLDSAVTFASRPGHPLPDLIGSSQSPCMRRAWQIIDLKPRTNVNDKFVRLPNTVIALPIGPTLEDQRAATPDRTHCIGFPRSLPESDATARNRLDEAEDFK